jgi:hypothetical protein
MSVVWTGGFEVCIGGFEVCIGGFEVCIGGFAVCTGGFEVGFGGVENQSSWEISRVFAASSPTAGADDDIQGLFITKKDCTHVSRCRRPGHSRLASLIL